MSKSYSTVNTTAIDNRQVLESGAVGLTGSSGNTINYTDDGAIKAATGFAAKAADVLGQSTSDLFGTSQMLFKDSLGLAGTSLDKTVTAIKDAYSEAKGGGTQTYIVFGVLAAIVAGVYFVWGRK